MTKADLIQGVAEAARITPAQAGRAVNGMMVLIVKAIQNEGRWDYQGFGLFKKVQQAAVSRPSPQDRTKIINTPARNTVKFKASPALKALVK